MSSPAARPARRPGLHDDVFWSSVQERELRLQRCSACREVRYPPGPVCPKCLDDRWTWDRMSGEAKVVAWTTFHRKYFDDLPVPYVIVSAELPEGPLLVADFAASAGVVAVIGMEVRLEFVLVRTGAEPWWIYQWVPAP